MHILSHPRISWSFSVSSSLSHFLSLCSVSKQWVVWQQEACRIWQQSSSHHPLIPTVPMLRQRPLWYEIRRLLCNFHIHMLLSTVTSLSHDSEFSVQVLAFPGRNMKFHSFSHTGHFHLSELRLCMLVYVGAETVCLFGESWRSLSFSQF